MCWTWISLESRKELTKTIDIVMAFAQTKQFWLDCLSVAALFLEFGTPQAFPSVQAFRNNKLAGAGGDGTGGVDPGPDGVYVDNWPNTRQGVRVLLVMLRGLRLFEQDDFGDHA